MGNNLKGNLVAVLQIVTLQDHNLWLRTVTNEKTAASDKLMQHILISIQYILLARYISTYFSMRVRSNHTSLDTLHLPSYQWPHVLYPVVSPARIFKAGVTLQDFYPNFSPASQSELVSSANFWFNGSRQLETESSRVWGAQTRISDQSIKRWFLRPDSECNLL